MEKKLKICLLTEYFPPEPGAGSTRAYEHAKVWKNLGVDVLILTCMPHYPTGIIPDKYKNKILVKEKIDNIDIIRTFTYAAASKGLIKRSIAYFTFMISSVIQGISSLKNMDYIIATSPPFSIGISGWILSKLKRIPLIFEVRDMWPDSLIQLEQLKNKYLIRLLEFSEKKIYSSSKYIVSVTDSYCSLIEQKGVDRSKIKVIKNGVDTNFFKPIQKSENLLLLHNLSEKKIVSYFGNFGLSQPIGLIIELAKLFKSNNKIHFLLIGDGERREQILNKIEEYKLNNVSILKTVNKNDLLRYYSISDLMMVPLKNIPLFKTVIPSKIFEIMAVGKPIVFNVDGEARKIVEEANAGVYVDFYDVKTTGDKIVTLLNDKDRLEKYSKNGRAFVIKYFNRQSLAEFYINLLEEN